MDSKFLWSDGDKVIVLNTRGATELMAKLKAFLDRNREEDGNGQRYLSGGSPGGEAGQGTGTKGEEER